MSQSQQTEEDTNIIYIKDLDALTNLELEEMAEKKRVVKKPSGGSSIWADKSTQQCLFCGEYYDKGNHKSRNLLGAIKQSFHVRFCQSCYNHFDNAWLGGKDGCGCARCELYIKAHYDVTGNELWDDVVKFLKERINETVKIVNWVQDDLSGVKRTCQYTVPEDASQQTQQSNSLSEESSSYVASQPSQQSMDYRVEDCKKMVIVGEYGDEMMVKTRSSAQIPGNAVQPSLVVVKEKSAATIEKDLKKVLRRAISSMLSLYLSDWSDLSLAKNLIAENCNSVDARREAFLKCFLSSASLYQIRQSAQTAMSLGAPRYRLLRERLEELVDADIQKIDVDWTQVILNICIKGDSQWFILFGLAKGAQKELVSDNGDINYGQLLETSVRKMEISSFCPSITGTVSLGLSNCIVSGHDTVDDGQVEDVIWMRSSLPTRQTQYKEALVTAFQYLQHIRLKRGLESNPLLMVSLQSRYQSVEAVAKFFAANFPSLKRVFMQRTGRLSISAPDNQAFLNVLRQKGVKVYFDYEDKEVTHSDMYLAADFALQESSVQGSKASKSRVTKRNRSFSV